MSTDACCGSLKKLPVPIVADRAARYIIGYQSPRALVLDAKNRVWMVIPALYLDPKLWIGTYEISGSNLLEITKLIARDLQHMLDTGVVR